MSCLSCKSYMSYWSYSYFGRSYTSIMELSELFLVFKAFQLKPVFQISIWYIMRYLREILHGYDQSLISHTNWYRQCLTFTYSLKIRNTSDCLNYISRNIEQLKDCITILFVFLGHWNVLVDRARWLAPVDAQGGIRLLAWNISFHHIVILRPNS
jgi:hypothetical protein